MAQGKDSNVPTVDACRRRIADEIAPAGAYVGSVGNSNRQSG